MDNFLIGLGELIYGRSGLKGSGVEKGVQTDIQEQIRAEAKEFGGQAQLGAESKEFGGQAQIGAESKEFGGQAQIIEEKSEPNLPGGWVPQDLPSVNLVPPARPMIEDTPQTFFEGSTAAETHE